MRNFQDTFETRKRSFFLYFLNFHDCAFNIIYYIVETCFMEYSEDYNKTFGSLYQFATDDRILDGDCVIADSISECEKMMIGMEIYWKNEYNAVFKIVE